MPDLYIRKPDPPPRANGRCVVCGGKRGRLPKTGTQRSRQQLARELATDPFCSTICARKWHGTEIAGSPDKAPPADLEWETV